MLVFRRATHNIGGVYIVTPEMRARLEPVWNEHGLIGHMLESQRFMPLDELWANHRKYEQDHPQDCTPNVTPAQLVVGLAKLIEAGAVEVKEVACVPGGESG
jgi:hypothetical protein